MIRSALLVSALIAFGAAQANAETTVVHARDLNLSHAADARVLDQRIQSAALDVCGAPYGSSAAVVQDVQKSACFRQAVTTAVASIPTKLNLAAVAQ